MQLTSAEVNSIINAIEYANEQALTSNIDAYDCGEEFLEREAAHMQAIAEELQQLVESEEEATIVFLP